MPTPQVPGDELQLPLFIDGLADGTPFTLESLIQDYAGPGTYDLDQLSGLGSTFTLVLGEDRFQARPDGPATATITVEADGSATVAITGFQEDDGSGGYGEQVDAAIDWTCQDA